MNWAGVNFETIYILLAVIFFRLTIYAGLEHALQRGRKWAWQLLFLANALFAGFLISLLRSEAVEHNWFNLFAVYGAVLYLGFKLTRTGSNQGNA